MSKNKALKEAIKESEVDPSEEAIKVLAAAAKKQEDDCLKELMATLDKYGFHLQVEQNIRVVRNK
jgi:hypothetical protein